MLSRLCQGAHIQRTWAALQQQQLRPPWLLIWYLAFDSRCHYQRILVLIGVENCSQPFFGSRQSSLFTINSCLTRLKQIYPSKDPLYICLYSLVSGCSAKLRVFTEKIPKENSKNKKLLWLNSYAANLWSTCPKIIYFLDPPSTPADLAVKGIVTNKLI